MDINWSLIKTEMKRDFGDLFASNSPSFSNIDEGINLFQKVIYSNISNSQLGGLARTLPQALHEAYTNKIGDQGPLRIMADNLEPYFKKIGIIANLDSAEAILSKELMPLLKLLNLNTSLTNQARGGYPQLSEANLHTFSGQPEYLEYICDAYLTRNKVHEAPDWNRITVLHKMTNLLTVYIYTALKYNLQITSLPDSTQADQSIREKISTDQQYLYHFISFGETTNKIRNQIVTSYVLNHLREYPNCNLNQVKEKVNIFFATDMNNGYYQSLIGKLQQEKRVVVDKETQNIHLSADEFKRISSVQKNFEENRNIFFLYLEDTARKFNISHLISDVFDRLRQFIESNYNVDLAEAYSRGQLVETDQNQAFQDFIQYLQSITTDKPTAVNLFRDLIELSKDSDFLVRMCASKAFATLTNPDRFEQYIHQQEKVVYLDTQIILFALCLDYVKDPKYDNYYFKTVEELIDLASENRNITLKVSKLYLQEVAYQLKLALLLIPFEEVSKVKFSSNIFYQFYWHLKESSMLEEEDNSFAEFMWNFFQLEENDAYASDFNLIVSNNLYRFLESLNIEVEKLPNYENREEAVAVLNKVLEEDHFRYRPKHVKANDALMMCHLCNPEAHVIEPFFLSWDKSFTKFRKAYLEKYSRANLLSFHLFNPARFINHFSLIKLKINPQALTNEFLSILDSLEIHENTQTVWDAINKFLNIENLNAQQKRRYIIKIKDLFENELNYSIDDVEDIEKTQRVVLPFEDVLSRINEYYNNSEKYSISDFRNLLLNDEHFDIVSKLILQTVSTPETEGLIFDKMNLLIDTLKKNDDSKS